MAIGPLISLGGNLENPRAAKPSDFTVGVPALAPAGQEEGKGKLVKLSVNQEGPQHSQDGGIHKGAIWGKADWTVGQSEGGGGTSIKYDCTVDLASGQMSPEACKQTY